MISRNTLVQSLAFAGLVAAAGSAQATITVYTDPVAFAAVLLVSGTDSFTDVDVSGPTAGPLLRSAGSFGYTATTFDPLTTTATNVFYGAAVTVPSNPALSTLSATDGIALGSFTGGVGALGGNFFGTNFLGSFSASEIIVKVTDADGTVEQTILNATASSFLGFVSSRGELISASIESVQSATSGSFLWPTVDNLVLAAVPEPETYALMLGGLALVGWMARRRRV
jgi:PEP-CTERM motif